MYYCMKKLIEFCCWLNECFRQGCSIIIKRLINGLLLSSVKRQMENWTGWPFTMHLLKITFMSQRTTVPVDTFVLTTVPGAHILVKWIKPVETQPSIGLCTF